MRNRWHFLVHIERFYEFCFIDIINQLEEDLKHVINMFSQLIIKMFILLVIKISNYYKD